MTRALGKAHCSLPFLWDTSVLGEKALPPPQPLSANLPTVTVLAVYELPSAPFDQ